MLPFLAFLLGATPVYSLTCHCFNGSRCESNGFCANGCELQWYGPGCQVGNVAFNKTARQSTTLSARYSAIAAIDGVIPSNYEVPHFCTHTADSNPAGAMKGFSWWDVTLDPTNYFVILNVTLLNRRNVNRNRLANFIILHSNESEGDPDPNNNTWHEFARENGTVGDSRTYTSKNAVMAKRVAIYLKAFTENPEAILSLCEVQIYGYEHYDCQSGFTGPMCLLRACDQCTSTGGTCTGEFGNCRYDVCPDQSLLPPDCWKTLSNVSGLDVLSTTTCNSVIFSAVLPDTHPNIAASWLQLTVTTFADREVLNTQLSLRETNSAYCNFSNATANTSYNVSLRLVYCDSTNHTCFQSSGSKDFTVLTGKREYVINRNDSCVFVTVSSSTLECEPLSAIQLACDSKVDGGVAHHSSKTYVCGLESEGTYNCTVTATVNANMIEIQSVYNIIVLGPHYTSAIPTENITGAMGEVLPGAIGGVLPGAIGGSVTVIVTSVAIIAIIYCRRQRNAECHSSAVEQDIRHNGPTPAIAFDLTRLPSFHKEQYDNPYESLHNDLQQQNTGDYASLNSLP